MEVVKEFLEKNGFEYYEINDYFHNDNCVVKIGETSYTIISYEVCFNEEYTMYSQDLNIYWLIGVLTYYNLIDKNYNQ